jgi:hypothetical protein
METIAPQLLQAVGRQGEVIVERHPGKVRDEANQYSRLHEAGILERRARQMLFNLLCLKGLRSQGVL